MTEPSHAPVSAPTPVIAGRWTVAAWAIGAGVCIAGAVPPWGWWPLAFIGFALFDQLLIGTTAKQRFKRGWLVTASWLFPAMLWMFDLTAPGYIVASALYAAYFGVACALTPNDGPWRFITFPGSFALAELARWYWPFGGVPLANVALGQVDSPLAITARLAGPGLIIVLVVMLGQALSVAVQAQRSPGGFASARRHVGLAAAITIVFIAAGWLHPRAEIVREIDVAVVQGGGPTRTRASSNQEPVVLARHIEATREITGPVDLILWPENVVNPGRFLDFEEAERRVGQVAIDTGAVLLPGWFHPISDVNSANYHTAVSPTGEVLDRYDKERIVPFGEYVPLRGFIENFTDELPGRDVLAGTGEPVLETPVGPIGVAISWEAYFSRRSREAMQNGAQLLTNPTNGSSFWLTQVHTQQVASNQLRAIENDRWLLMAGPTGLSAVIDPNGNLIQRTDIGEREVLFDTVEMRDGRTLASYVGPWPILLYGLLVSAAGLSVVRSGRTNT